MRRLPLALLLVASACKSGDPAPDGITREKAPQIAKPVQAPARATAVPANVAPGRPHIEWPESVAWKTWDEGKRLAQQTNKPILLLVYANWCPHCRELAPVFSDPEVQKLSSQMILIKQDADADAPWLGETVGRLGTYVPRVFFLRPDGTVRADITSGNGRYPYFYTPEGIAALRASMRRAMES